MTASQLTPDGIRELREMIDREQTLYKMVLDAIVSPGAGPEQSPRDLAAAALGLQL